MEYAQVRVFACALLCVTCHVTGLVCLLPLGAKAAAPPYELLG